MQRRDDPAARMSRSSSRSGSMDPTGAHPSGRQTPSQQPPLPHRSRGGGGGSHGAVRASPAISRHRCCRLRPRVPTRQWAGQLRPRSCPAQPQPRSRWSRRTSTCPNSGRRRTHSTRPSLTPCSC
ncbi:hypothetical protein P7K49_007340 [Saguinus oedipus]|uniref:Uncharacterized protein n=1 Tax=Saguinus oedipus TaxID=9490 RepID=A0ABQ9VUL7_SAGOE|nr:hypothetical protein P7K49_007340 [Saguinus oedipus]